MKRKVNTILSCLTAAVLAVVACTLSPTVVKAEASTMVTLTFETTVNSRQVYAPELEQIKTGLDTDSILWVRDCCNYVNFITHGEKQVDPATVIPVVKSALKAGTNPIHVNLSNYLKGAAPATAAGTTGAASSGTNGLALLSSCTTKYRENQDRALNIRVAASRINGVTLQPGQAFSYSATILPRTVANGYGPGNVISGKTYVKGIGGGICQVSSTLNAAVLRSGIAPIERHAHSRDVGYLPAGMDATISGNTLDYKFVNPYSYPLTISASAQGGVLTVALFSDPAALSGVVYEVRSGANATYIIGKQNGVQVSNVRAY